MTNRLDEQIEPIVNQIIKQKPAPLRCTITKVYEDNIHVDANTNQGIIKYAETIGNPVVGNIGIIIFLEQDFNDYLIITK